MNIFYIDKDPRIAAENMVDKHIIKMIRSTKPHLNTDIR
jgi:hypothetical protein